jgi:hypothetical protein
MADHPDTESQQAQGEADADGFHRSRLTTHADNLAHEVRLHFETLAHANLPEPGSGFEPGSSVSIVVALRENSQFVGHSLSGVPASVARASEL